MSTTGSPSDAFRQIAADFCRWCEGESLGPQPQLQASVWLARLHAAALQLPETESENDEGLPELPHVDLIRAQRNLAVFAGVLYRTVFDPDPRNTDDPVIGDIGDDLLDTYKDIKAGSVLCDRGQPQEALWHWSFLHRIHWGKHAVGALAALQAALRSSE